jgi:hypothetical protein
MPRYEDGRPVDPDNDRLYKRPKAWAKVKAALGRQEGLDKLFAGLEQVDGYCPRLMLVAAISHFLTMSRQEQREALTEHFARSTAHRRADDALLAREKLSGPECEALQADLDEAARKIAGEPGQ